MSRQVLLPPHGRTSKNLVNALNATSNGPALLCGTSRQLLESLYGAKSIVPFANALFLYGDDKGDLSNIIYAITILETY